MKLSTLLSVKSSTGRFILSPFKVPTFHSTHIRPRLHSGQHETSGAHIPILSARDVRVLLELPQSIGEVMWRIRVFEHEHKSTKRTRPASRNSVFLIEHSVTKYRTPSNQVADRENNVQNCSAQASSSSACLRCPPGTYGEEQGATSCSVCTPCPMGSYNPSSESSSTLMLRSCREHHNVFPACSDKRHGFDVPN